MDKNEFIAIKDIRGGMKNINVIFIILEATQSTKTKENREVFSFKVADSSACINCSIWDEPGKLIQPGDIIRMVKCYANVWKGCLTLYSGKTGEISRIGDFCMVFNDTYDMSQRNFNMNEFQPNQNSSSSASVQNSATNGNGRPSLERNNSQQAQQQQTLPPSQTLSSGEKPKVSNSNQSKNFQRRPMNKK